MTFGETILLGFVQGLSEFLPISSSGHLVVVRLLAGIADTQGNAFDAFLHLGTLLAVLVYFRATWVAMVRSFLPAAPDTASRRLAAHLAIATIPGATAGYFLEDIVSTVFRNPSLVAGWLLFTAAVLIISDKWRRGSAEPQTIATLSWRQAMIVGFAQTVALIPGVSRSGMTIAAGRVLGLSRAEAASFSFLLSAPIIAGAGLHSLIGLTDSALFSPQVLLAGFVTAFVAGYAAIHLLLTMVRRISFTPFAVYLVAAALLIFYVS